MPRNPNCTACVLHESSSNVCVWGHGTGEAFLVGEAPGKNEARTGKPFTGEAGTQVLRPVLAEFGLSDAYITNAAKCRPPENRKPEPNELKACAPYLREELETRKPKVVLLMGASAMKAVIRKTQVTAMNGQLVEKDGITYVCSFHPAAVLRDPSKMGAFRTAVARYASVLNGTFDNEPEIDYRIVKRSTLDEFINQWNNAEQASFDCETDGLDWWRESFRIHCISFSLNPGDTWVLPLKLTPVLPPEGQRSLLQHLVKTSANKRMVAQNGKFDNLCLMSQYGVRFHLTTDTMLAHHLLDENSEHGLKSMSRVELNAPDYDLPLEDKIRPKDPAKLYKYGALDGQYTRQLGDLYLERLAQDPQLDKIYHRLVMRAARAFEEIEFNGLYVDLKRMAEVEREEKITVARLEKELNQMAGRIVNWDSPPQVAQVLYSKLGLTPTVLTAKGAPSTGELALADLKHPVVKVLIEYREHAKFLSTYIEGWKEFMDGPHLFLSTKLHGTVTGRYSSRLHQVPRDGTVRNLITAPRGWRFVVADFSQIELRIAAIMSKDPALLECYRTGVDVHWRTLISGLEQDVSDENFKLVIETARSAVDTINPDFNECLEIVNQLGPDQAAEIDKYWKELRKLAKSENFGFLFGMYPKKFITYAKTKYGYEPTIEAATAARDRFFRLYRRLPDWHERQKKLAKLDGFVRNFLGRKRRLPQIHSRDREAIGEAEREAVNAPVQGFVGDLKAAALVEIHEEFNRDVLRIVGEVHDSILMWVREEHIDSSLSRVKQIMEHPALLDEFGISFPIPIEVELEVGVWGKGVKWRPQ